MNIDQKTKKLMLEAMAHGFSMSSCDFNSEDFGGTNDIIKHISEALDDYLIDRDIEAEPESFKPYISGGGCINVTGDFNNNNRNIYIDGE